MTATERSLDALCKRSFLTLWSYPTPFRDQDMRKGQGKEICDLLGVFENDVLLFSDKSIAFPNTGDLERDWKRWSKRAVMESAAQLRGAERWIRAHPSRVFTDRECTTRLPVDLPSNPSFHHIVVAHGAAERCATELGGTGSLMICPHSAGGSFPFTARYPNSGAGFLHVLDDTTLGIVLEARDTVSDFVHYLRAKEDFIASGRLVSAAGEEDLLAYYLKTTDKRSEHAFVFPDSADAVTILEGFWEDFSRSPERAAQVEANKISYVWDALIERFSKHALAGTQYHTSHPELNEQEKGLRILARESRLCRRMLGAALMGLIQSTPPNKRATRLVVPTASQSLTATNYLFLLLPKSPDVPEANYRDLRSKLLEQYCRIVKLDRPSAEDIVGIAMEPHTRAGNSEDFLYFDARVWTDEHVVRARAMKEDLIAHGLLETRGYSELHVREYPTASSPGLTVHARGPIQMKGRDRNTPCRCGSGRKTKKCCGARA